MLDRCLVFQSVLAKIQNQNQTKNSNNNNHSNSGKKKKKKKKKEKKRVQHKNNSYKETPRHIYAKYSGIAKRQNVKRKDFHCEIKVSDHMLQLQISQSVSVLIFLP